MLALNRLAKAASSKAQENKETVITPRHITAVASVSRPMLTVSVMQERHMHKLSFILFHVGCIGKSERQLVHVSILFLL